MANSDGGPDWQEAVERPQKHMRKKAHIQIQDLENPHKSQI